MPLTYTPRKFIPYPAYHYLYMIEADYRVMGDETGGAGALLRRTIQSLNVTEHIFSTKIDEDLVNLRPEIFGRLKPARALGAPVSEFLIQ